MKEFRSSEELRMIVMNVFDDAVEEVAEQFLDALKENIQKIVYDYGDEYRTYYVGGTAEPTYEFLESWDKTKEKLKSSVKATIFQNWEEMSFRPDEYVHGSEQNGDERENLANILVKGTKNSVFGHGWWESPRDFWTPTMNLFKDGTIDKWIIGACSSRGLLVQKV